MYLYKSKVVNMKYYICEKGKMMFSNTSNVFKNFIAHFGDRIWIPEEAEFRLEQLFVPITSSAATPWTQL